MTSQNPQSDIYDPKTLAVMDQAFAAIWNVLRADDPFRDYANDSELRIAIGHKLMNLVADGVTDPSRLRQLTLESLLLPVTEERSVLSLRIRAASIRGKGSRRKRLPEEDLRPQMQEDVHNDQQDLSHVAESYCGFCYHRRFWQRELRRRLYGPPRKAIPGNPRP